VICGSNLAWDLGSPLSFAAEQICKVVWSLGWSDLVWSGLLGSVLSVRLGEVK
jgi:hypothetical protein